jgi:glucose/arabinose dehydrogenase
MLWIGMGDGGSAGDPRNNAQNGQTLLGKMLRIDVDAGFPYAIPGDNPFLSNPTVRDEIWALGLRNPWKYSFDRLTGDLFIGDVGQNAVEEVNFEPADSTGGRNYGWRRMEGTECFDPRAGCNDGSLVLPILEYPHSEGCSVTGGYRYRGTEMPEHAGTYFFADFCSGDVWGGRLDDETGVWSRTLLADTSLAVSTFGEDENGELYVASLGGVLHRLQGETLCEVDPTAGGPVFQVKNVSSRTLAASIALRRDSSMIARAGDDGSFLLPGGFSMDVFTVGPGAPGGRYHLECTFVDPATGAFAGRGSRTIIIPD